jgi:hypothetical protein
MIDNIKKKKNITLAIENNQINNINNADSIIKQKNLSI